MDGLIASIRVMLVSVKLCCSFLRTQSSELIVATNLDKVKHKQRQHVIYCSHVLSESVHYTTCKRENRVQMLTARPASHENIGVLLLRLSLTHLSSWCSGQTLVPVAQN